MYGIRRLFFKIEDFWYMTDKEALKEIARQEKRFAAANCGRGVS